MTTAPSSCAWCSVLYPEEASKFGPGFKTANFSSMFLFSGNTIESGGIKMHATNDLTRSVNAAATLVQHVSKIIVLFLYNVSSFTSNQMQSAECFPERQSPQIHAKIASFFRFLDVITNRPLLTPSLRRLAVSVGYNNSFVRLTWKFQ